jgi:hypothetical protein
MWAFCFQSLFREYGWQFLRHVGAPHPVRTASAVVDSGRLDLAGDVVTTFNGAPAPTLEGPRSIVGVGFCLKPNAPPCPSGRPNHDCLYLERLLPSGASSIPAACRQCGIREIGLMALGRGAAFYIMTSARDILFDLFTPALGERRFTAGLFVLCRYSLRPFAVGLLASGVRAWLLPFERGDCADYRTWLAADRGIKDERTTIGERSQETIRELLRNGTKTRIRFKRFERRGNVLEPRSVNRVRSSAFGRAPKVPLERERRIARATRGF